MEEKLPLCYNESINTSEHTKLILPYYRTSLGTSSLHYQGCKIWNEITKSLNSFRIKQTKLFSNKFQELLLEELNND